MNRPPEDQMMTSGEAAKYLGVTRMRMAYLIKTEPMTVYSDPRDTRYRLLLRSEVERVKTARETLKKLAPVAA